MLVNPLADAMLYLSDSLPELLHNRLSLERLNRIALRRRGHNNKRNDRHSALRLLQSIIQSRERLDEHIHALIPVLVPSGREHIEGVIDIEVVVAVKVAADEVVDLGFGGGVEVLELVHGLELDDVEAVGDDAVGLALEEVLGLVGGDVRDGGEDVGAVRGAPLDAVAVVDAAFAGLVVDVEVLEVVVEVDGAGAEVATEEGCVGCEDGGDVDVSLAAEGDGEPGLPLVEVGDDGFFELVAHVLQECKLSVCVNKKRTDGPRRGTRRRDSQRRWSRSSRDRSVASGCPRGSRDRPSTRRGGGRRCRYRRGGRGARLR